MTVEPTYRIDRHLKDGDNKLLWEKLQDSLDHLGSYGVLVPDTRLDAIADAWEAFKEAKLLRSHPLEVNTWNRMFDLLDALTKDNNDG